MIDLDRIQRFEWDLGNARKNEQEHEISQAEAEQIFCNFPLRLADDVRHSELEPRYHALGMTNTGKMLHLTFTLRANGTLIRVISARAMNRRERQQYEEET
jgi:hypothetical protein